MSKTIQDIFKYDADLKQHILWQYENAPALKSLIEQKAAWYKVNVNDFWNYIRANFLNIKTANDWGLNLWGKILKVKRIYKINGADISLSTELYRRLVLGKLQLLYSNGTVPEIHKYCNNVFSDYVTPFSWAVLVFDNHDMSITYQLNFSPTTEELALILSRDFFPTPAGVEEHINIIPYKNIFGFYRTEFQPFNQVPFWNGQTI